MRFQCPECGGVVAVENSDLGSMVQCGHCAKIVQVPSSRVAPGCLIGDFIIQKELGRGGMGVVYLAYQISLDRPAAVKVLADQFANNTEFVTGFIKEARAAAKLNHPHIVQAYAVGEDEGVFYFAMENIDGETMKAVLKREQVVPVLQAIEIIRQIAEALNYAWIEQKLIHRDIKPDNIMLTSSGRAKLADLGLARVAGDKDDSEGDEVMGTPQYISPEHLTGAPMDVRSDIYSLGATFYHFVTGRFPFDGKTGAEIAQKHLTDPLVPPNQVNPAVPECVARIIEKMMAKNPVMRYQSAEQLVDDLRIAKKAVESGTAAATSTRSAPIGKKPAMRLKGGGSGTKTQQRTGKHGKAAENPEDTLSNASFSQVIKQQKREQKKQKYLVPVVLGCVVLAAALVGGAVFFYGEKLGILPKSGEQSADGAGEEKKAEETAAVKEMKEIMALASQNKDVEEIRTRCEKFLSGYSGPENEAEKQVFPEFMAVFSRADEFKLKEARAKAAESHEKLLAERAKQTAKQAAEAKEKARIAEENKKKQLELQRQKAAKEAELKAKIQEAKLAFLKAKSETLTEIFTNAMKGDFKAAKDILDTNKDEAVKVIDAIPQVKSMVQPQLNWLNQLSGQLADCAEIHGSVLKDGKLLADCEFEVKGKKVVIHEIKKDKLIYKAGKKYLAIPLHNLSAGDKSELVRMTAEKQGKSDSLYLYFILTGDAEGLKNLRAGMTDDQKKAVKQCLDEFTPALKAVLNDLPDARKNKMAKHFGKIPEFKELF